MTPSVLCDYCGRDAPLTPGKTVYPHRPDLAHLNFYMCKLCDAYVGVHHNSTRPLGRLANRELRLAKSQAHRVFDPIWQTGRMSRTGAYAWLAREMQLTTAQAHIGRFDLAQCQAVCELVKQLSH